MRIEGERESGNIEDRRGIGGGGLAVGGGIGTVILALVVWFMGGDPRQVVQQQQQQGGGAPSGQVGAPSAADDQTTRFMRVVLASTEDVWRDQFRKQLKREYQAPVLVLFSGRVSSACGMATSATGPFYCPGDQKLYLDQAFFNELARRFKAPGDFAQAYVVAHEVGHHIQKLRGITDKVDAARRTLSKEEYNRVSVRLELQADFLAGVWAHHAQRTRKILEPGDLEEGIRAASAVGDDAIQKAARGYVVPDSFTHGTSRQRAAWFRKGFQTGDLNQGNTFEMPDPE
jgi:predicted metalloprotease